MEDEHAESAHEIEEFGTQLDETDSEAATRTLFEPSGARTQTALFSNGHLPVGAQKSQLKNRELTAIPLLKVVAAAHGETGGHLSSQLSGPAEGIIAAPVLPQLELERAFFR